MGRNDEHTLNTALADRLRRKNPAWKKSDHLSSETLKALESGADRTSSPSPPEAPRSRWRPRWSRRPPSRKTPGSGLDDLPEQEAGDEGTGAGEQPAVKLA